MSVRRKKPPTVRVEVRAIRDLTPAPYNPRRIAPEALAGLRESITRFGLVQPIVVNERTGHVVGGHQRLKVLEESGEVACQVAVVDLSDSEEKALNVALNSPAIEGEFTDDLGALLEEIAAEEAELYEALRLGELESDIPEEIEPQEGEDDAPEVQAEPVTQMGDLWLLGAHRLLCGDSTVATDADRVMGGGKPHLMVTDPPYGVEYDANWRNEADRANGKPYGARAVGKVQNDGRADWREAWALFPGEVAYVWHAGVHASTVEESLTVCGFEIRSQIIWGKPRFAISRGHYHWQHEPCWYAVRKAGTGHWQGDRSQTTLWMIEHNKSETGHSTQKPVESMRRPMLNNSQAGDLVYEPFSGSGTTIIAGETIGRRVCAIELNPTYVDVAVRRWQMFTGKAATLDGDGRTFDEVAGERRGG